VPRIGYSHERRVFKFASIAVQLDGLKRQITLSRVLRDNLGPRTDFARVLDWKLETPSPRPPRSRKCSCLAYLRKKLTETAPLLEVPERLRQIAWSVEEGALAKLEVRLALNVALKKLRPMAQGVKRR
jgi:hypothetical protein